MATVVVAGDDLACEVAARALGAAGVARLILLRRGGALLPEVIAAIYESNPAVRIDTRPWPAAFTVTTEPTQTPGQELGAAWVAAIAGAAVLVRSGFDDDPMLRAAVRLGLPVVVMRAREDGVDVLSFRCHGPCPHAPLNVPENHVAAAGGGAAAVVAGHLAAAEAVVLLAGAATGEGRARHLRIPLGKATEGPPADAGETLPRAVDLPWAPECFACGGRGMEMSLS